MPNSGALTNRSQCCAQGVRHAQRSTAFEPGHVSSILPRLLRNRADRTYARHARSPLDRGIASIQQPGLAGHRRSKALNSRSNGIGRGRGTAPLRTGRRRSQCERVIITRHRIPTAELVRCDRRGGIDFDKLETARRRLGIEGDGEGWPEEFNDPAFSRKALGLDDE